MSRRSMRLIAAAAAVLGLAACGGGSSAPASVQQCKTAMRAGFQHALAHPSDPAQTEPPACHGLSGAELRKLVGQVMSGQLSRH